MERLSGRKLAAFIAGEASVPGADAAIRALADMLGRRAEPDRVIRAGAACAMGALPEEVASLVDWREFEDFSASLFEARGYDVSKNIVLTKPRMQIDLLARSSMALAVDCKHWARARGGATLAAASEAQLRRARALRQKRPSLEPIASVILVLANQQERFSQGAAVVPVYALFDFLDNLDSYGELLLAV